MKRLYDELILEHLKKYRQMFFLVGPRQVGKTTAGLSLQSSFEPFTYINWDRIEDRQLITSGIEKQTEKLGLTAMHPSQGLVFFDEIHKYGKWKTFLKGFFDTYEKRIKIFVTGSARLAVYQRGGDSLMGRYFYYRMHPLSVGELVNPNLCEQEIRLPARIPDDQWQALLRFGGFPEPLQQAEDSFAMRWNRLRRDQLFREDLRDLTMVQDIGQLELLSELVRQQAGQLTTYTQLSKKVNITVPTVKAWLELLRSVYYLFSVRPWSQNVTRSLIKEPKYYMWDWSLVDNPGARAENFLACHLLKAVHFWTDRGYGEYDLYFLRDKDKREVDFVVTRDRKPWFLVEVKSSSGCSLSPSLRYFQRQLDAPHAFQVHLDGEYVDQDCFSYQQPIIVPARTFLSQLV